MGCKLHWKGYQCVDRQVRRLQNARAHAKGAGPRKVRRPTQNAWAALWVRGTPSARTRAKSVGRGSIARAALSAQDAIAWRGEWATLPTHLPRTCHAMPTQCNRGSTRVGRNKQQLPATLRVNDIGVIDMYWCKHYKMSSLKLSLPMTWSKFFVFEIWKKNPQESTYFIATR